MVVPPLHVRSTRTVARLSRRGDGTCLVALRLSYAQPSPDTPARGGGGSVTPVGSTALPAFRSRYR